MLKHVQLCLRWRLRRWRTRSGVFGLQSRHRLHGLRPSCAATAALSAAALAAAALAAAGAAAATALALAAPTNPNPEHRR